MTTTPAAARVSGTIKALYKRACEVVHHDHDCPAIGGNGDADCKCDAVPFLNDFEALAAIQPDPEPQPLAWVCWDLAIGCGAKNITTDRHLVDARLKQPNSWQVEPLYATPSSAATIANLTAERDQARAEGILAGLAQARDICKRLRHRDDLTEDKRCGVLEGALAIQDEIARLDQRKEPHP